MDLPTMIMICSVYSQPSTVNAMVQQDAHQKPLAVTVVSASGAPDVTKSDFKNADAAIAYTKAQLNAGNQVRVGMMQIPSTWFGTISNTGTTLSDLFSSCKNTAVGTDLLNQAATYCAGFTSSGRERDRCTLSFYRTGDAKAGFDYADQVLAYASTNPFVVPASSLIPKVNYPSAMKDAGLALPAPTFSDDIGDLGDVNAK